MKKKVFTLIELLIVIVIIGIILGALSLLAWKYVLRLRLLSDVKNFENFYYEIYGKTL
jgi:prepilin-type N-terminal cleavage/methylation domain-containing protein